MRPLPACALALAAAILAAGCGGAESTAASERGAAAKAAPRTGLPSLDRVGVPAGWKPSRTRDTTVVIDKPGAVVKDVLLRDADIIVRAPNVTIRRVKLQGGRIFNWPDGSCGNGMVIEDTTIEPAPGKTDSLDSEAVIGDGGYTARRVKIWRRAEGFRVGGRSGGCGPVRIEGSFAKIVIPDGHCESHADGIQGYDGPPVTVVDTTIDFREASCGTAPVFVPDGQGNTSATFDNVLLLGGGIPFRVGVPAKVHRLSIGNRSWDYAPVDVNCSLVQHWDARIVTVTDAYKIARTVRKQRCR
jgi:hypothetical protein